MKNRRNGFVFEASCLFIVGLLFLMWANSGFAGSGGVTVGTTAVKVLPRSGVAGSAWVTNTAYTAGSYAKIGGITYMCLVAGTTASNAPAATRAHDIADNTVTWRPVPKDNRSFMALVNNSESGVLYISTYTNVSASTGLRLNAAGGNIVLTGGDAFQDEVFAVYMGDTGVVSTIDW